MRKLSLWGMVVLWAACGGGSDEPADPATARAEVSALLPGIVDDGSDSLDAAGDAQGMQDLRASMTSLQRSFAGLPFDFPLADEGALVAKALAPQTAEERPGAAAARWLAENLFTEANYEGDGVYRIRGAVVCPVEDGETAPDPACVADVDAAELRLRVGRAAGGGLNLTLLVGPDRDEPLALRLRVGLCDLALDLAEARSALQHLAFVVGEELDLPATMRGVVALRVERHAARHVEASFAVRSAVEIAGNMAGGAYAFTAAARDPLLAVELNAVAGRFTARLDVGAVSLRAPWSAVSPESLASGAMAFDLRGLTGELILDAAGLALANAGLGGGPLTVKLDGATLFSVAVETFDLGIAAGAAQPVLDLDPGLDVEVVVALRPLADAGDEVESWALGERFTIAVGPTVQPLEGAVKVVDGSIDIAATEAGAAVHVGAGQCLLGSEVALGEHPVLGLFAAGACP